MWMSFGGREKIRLDEMVVLYNLWQANVLPAHWWEAERFMGQ
jgi:hypothetical protein